MRDNYESQTSKEKNEIKMGCKGICDTFKAKKPAKGSWYKFNKRCQLCATFIENRTITYCPCCGSKLRSLPRNKKYKEQFKAHLPTET